MRRLSLKIHGKMVKYGLLTALIPFLVRGAGALEIPLKSSAGGGISVGYVDMETVFQEYPETKKAKNEYYTELAKRRDDLAKKEQTLTALRQQIAVLQGTLMESGSPAVPAAPPVPPAAVPPDPMTIPSLSSLTAGPDGNSALNLSPPDPAAQGQETAPLSVSSASVAAANASVLDRRRDLVQKEQELEQARIDAAKAVKDLEETRSLQILGKLYNAMVQLAEENNISLIVDKSSILYGQQAIDLTDKLSRRIRGLPDTDEPF